MPNTDNIKTLQTRILNKIDDWSVWKEQNPTPLKGEICIVVVPAEAGAVIQEPSVLIKIGDGEKAFMDLPWLGATAADVHDWAKASVKPGYEAKEITGIDAYISAYVNEQMGISVDTDTQYQIVKVDDYNYKLQSKGKTDEAWADVANGTIVIPEYDDTALTERVTDVEAAIEVLNGTEAGSVKKSIDDAIAALDLANTYAAKTHSHEITEVNGLEDALAGKQAAGDYATKTEAQGYADAKDEAIAAAKKAGDDAAAALESYKETNDAAVKAADDKAVAAQQAADAKVASVTAGDASVTVGGTATAPTVSAKISQDADNALSLAEDGLKVVVPAAAEYTIVKAENSGEYAAIYNLTKNGEIVGASINIPKDLVVKSGSVVDGNIVLVLNDEENTEITIPADSLIEYVTSGSQTGDMVVINVSDDHKVTATITDGSITLAKLSTEVQTAIGKAHSHENADVLAGISEQNIVDWNDAVAKEHEHANKDVLDGITSEKVAAWDGAQAAAEATAAGALASAKTELEGKISDAQAAAEKVANDNNAAMDTRMQAVEAAKHEHSNKDELDLIQAGDVAKWNGAQAAAEATAAAALAEAKEELEGKITAEAERAADAEAKALEDAKAYTDELEGELATIAKTGNVDDLVQTENTYVIFDCGSATKNI